MLNHELIERVLYLKDAAAMYPEIIKKSTSRPNIMSTVYPDDVKPKTNCKPEARRKLTEDEKKLLKSMSYNAKADTDNTGILLAA